MWEHVKEGLLPLATYKQYETNKGTFWRVSGYLGVDPLTGKQTNYNKRGFKTKKEAKHYYDNAKLQFNNGVYDTSKPIRQTFETVYNEWLDIYADDVESSTLNKTKQYFRLHILPQFGHILIDKINSSLLQQTLKEWRLKYKSFKKFYNYTCRVLDYAHFKGYITENPKTKVIVPKAKVQYKQTKTTEDFYTKDELNQFLQYAEQYSKDLDNGMWYTFFRMLAFVGIRRGEALALTWNDINFKEKTINIDKALKVGDNNIPYIGDTKNSNSDRILTLDDITVSILKRWKVQQARILLGFGYNVTAPNQLLFSKLDNTHLDVSSPRNRLERICKKNNFKMINIHGFRHTHCSLLFEAGVPMKDVMDRLGHSDIQTTMNIYTHVTKESKNKSAQMFAKYVNF